MRIGDDSMADTRTVLSTVLFCFWWPTSKLLAAIAFVLSPFLRVLHFVLLPAIYLAHAIYAILSFPFRLHVLERIETVYIWVGVAGLIGCITGGILFLVFRFITSALKIDGVAEIERRENGRTVEEFRAARRGKKEPRVESASDLRVDKVAALRRRGMIAHPVLGEESEF